MSMMSDRLPAGLVSSIGDETSPLERTPLYLLIAALTDLSLVLQGEHMHVHALIGSHVRLPSL